ncbi:Cell death protease [Rhizina undulata]
MAAQRPAPVSAPAPTVAPITLEDIQKLWERSTMMFMQQIKAQMQPQQQQHIQPQAHRNAVPAVPTPFPKFPPEEFERTSTLLNQNLGPEYLQSRVAHGNKRVLYIAGERVIRIANDVFGYDGWYSVVVHENIDFIDSTPEGRYNVGISVTMRVGISNGAFHEDIGYGTADNGKSKGLAIEKAKKEAVTDGVKRALRNFGEVVGNCIYNKDYLEKIVKVRPQKKPTFEESNLRRPDDVERRHQVERESLVQPKSEPPVPLNFKRSMSPPKSPKRSLKHESSMKEHPRKEFPKKAKLYVPTSDDEGGDSDYDDPGWDNEEVLQDIEKLFVEKFDNVPVEPANDHDDTTKSFPPVKSVDMNLSIPGKSVAIFQAANGQSFPQARTFASPQNPNGFIQNQNGFKGPMQNPNAVKTHMQNQNGFKGPMQNPNAVKTHMQNQDGTKPSMGQFSRTVPQQAQLVQPLRPQNIVQPQHNSPIVQPRAPTTSLMTSSTLDPFETPTNGPDLSFKSFKVGASKDDIRPGDFNPGAVPKSWTGKVNHTTSRPVLKATVPLRPDDDELSATKFTSSANSASPLNLPESNIMTAINNNRNSFRPPSIIRPGNNGSPKVVGVKRHSDDASVVGMNAPNVDAVGSSSPTNSSQSMPSGSNSKKQKKG